MRFEDLLSQINNNNNNNNSVGGTGNGGVDLNPNDDDRLSSQPLPPLPAIITKTSQLKPPPTDSNNSKSDAILFTTTPDLKKMNPNSNNQKPTAPAPATDNSNSSNNNPNSIDDLNRILFSNYMNNNGNSASVSSNIAAAGGGGGSSAAGPNLFSSEMDQLNALLNVGGSNSNLFANNNNNVGASSSFSFADGDDSTSTSNNKNNNNILAEKLMLENYYAAMMQQQQTLQQNPSLMFGNLQNSGNTAGLIANGGLVTSQDTLLGSSNSQASSIEKQTTISNSPDGANQQFAPFNRPFVTNSPGPGGSATSTGGPNQPMDISGVIGRPPPSFHPHQMPFGPYLPYSPYRIAAPGPPMMAYHPGFSPGNSPFAGSTMSKNPSVHDGGGGGPPNPHPNLPLFHPSQALPPNYYPAPMMMSNFFPGSPGGVPTGGQPQSATEQQLILNQQLQNYYNYAAMAAAAANASASAAAVAGNNNEMPTTTVPSTSTVSSSNGRQFVNRQISSSSSAGSSSGTKSKSAQSQKNSQSLIGTTSSTTAAASATTGAPTTNRIRMNVEELFTLTKAFTESKIQESPNSNATPIANNNNSQANQSSSTVFVESTATITGSSSLKSKAANKKSKKSKPVSSLTSTTTTAVSSSSSSVRYDENNPMKAYDWNLAMKQQQQSDDDNGDKEANPDGTDNELKRFIDIVNKVSSNASVVNNRQDGDLNKNNKKSFESTNASSSADPMKKKRNRRNKNNNQEEAKVNQPLLHQKASAAPSASKIAYNELVKKNLEHKTTSSSSSSVPTSVPKETNNNNKKKNKQQNISAVSNTTTTTAAASRPIQPQPQQLQTKPNKKPANNLNQASTSSGPVPGPARQNQQSDRQDRKRTKQTANNNNTQNSVLMPASSLVVNKGAIPKPKERTYLNENFSMEVIKNFKQILMTSPNGAAAAEIINGQFNPKALSYLYTMILEYFRHLEFRFKLPTTDYVNLIDPHQYFYEDFNSFGSQFWDYVNESKFYPQELITKYVSLVKTYEQLHPPEILQLRTTLFKLKQSLSLVPKSQINDNAKNCPIRLEMITYQKVDPKNLYSQICELTSVEREISYFISVIQLSQLSLKNLDEFVSILNSALMSTELAQFGPEICTFGSLSNGLGTYNSDIDIFVKFDKLGSKILDYSTAVLALEVIEQIFQQNLGYKSKETIIYSRRCPIIKLNFRVCFAFLRNLVPAAEKDKQSQSQQSLKTLEFNKCDISLNQIYGVYNSKLLNFFAKIEPRFYELTMILKYWAKRRDLIGNNSLSTYAFTMLIIYFLQAQNPPILPTIVKLQKLAQKQKNKKRIKVHKWYFEFCDDLEMIGGPSTNTKKTPELLVNFFKFYRTYDFYNNAIRPKFGKSCKKFALRQEKQSEGIESMFNMCSYFCIEDPFVLDHNVGYNFRTKNIYRFTQLLNLIGEKITEENCIRLLLDDSPKNDVQPPLSPIFYIPSNLFYYEIVFPDLSRGQNSRNISRQFVYRPIHVTPGNLRLTVSSTGGTKTKADFHQLSRSLLSLFSLVITQLFNGYFQFPPGTFKLTLNDSRLQLNCMAEHGYVDYLIHFRKMYGMNELLQRCRPSSTNEINSKILKLKDIGYRLFRFNNQNKFCPHQRPKLEPLFSLDFSPLTDQMSNSNNSNNNNNYTDVSLGSSPLWCSMNLHTQANIFLNIVNEVLLQFSYAIDRSKPEEYFSNLVRQFFDVESTFHNSNNNQGMFNINSNNQQNPTNNLRQSYQFNANRQNH